MLLIAHQEALSKLQIGCRIFILWPIDDDCGSRYPALLARVLPERIAAVYANRVMEEVIIFWG